MLRTQTAGDMAQSSHSCFTLKSLHRCSVVSTASTHKAAQSHNICRHVDVCEEPCARCQMIKFTSFGQSDSSLQVEMKEAKLYFLI